MKNMQIYTKQNLKQLGFTLIEMLVVVSIFAIIGILSTRSVILTIQGSKKSETQVVVRENLNYVVSVLERNLRSAESVTCPNPSSLAIDYVSAQRIATTFSCVAQSGGYYVASGSARLNSDEILITNCSFTCTQENANIPPTVDISLSAKNANTTNTTDSIVTVGTQISVRNY